MTQPTKNIEKIAIDIAISLEGNTTREMRIDTIRKLLTAHTNELIDEIIGKIPPEIKGNIGTRGKYRNEYRSEILTLLNNLKSKTEDKNKEIR